MKIILVAFSFVLTSCYPFYEADQTNWTVGVRGTHKEVGDLIKSVVDPDGKTLAR